MNNDLLVIPDVVLDRLRKFFKEPTQVIVRPVEAFGGLSACDYVRAGHSWEEVLTVYERMFAWTPS